LQAGLGSPFRHHTVCAILQVLQNTEVDVPNTHICKFELIFKVLNKHKDKLFDLQNL